MPKYSPQEIEAKWQKYWEDNNIFRTPEPVAKQSKEEVHKQLKELRNEWERA